MPKMPEPEPGSAAFDLLRFYENWTLEPAANGSLRFLRRSGRTRRMQPPRFQLRRLQVSKPDVCAMHSGLASMYNSTPVEAPVL